MRTESRKWKQSSATLPRLASVQPAVGVPPVAIRRIPGGGAGLHGPEYAEHHPLTEGEMDMSFGAPYRTGDGCASAIDISPLPIAQILYPPSAGHQADGMDLRDHPTPHLPLHGGQHTPVSTPILLGRTGLSPPSRHTYDRLYNSAMRA